MNDILGEGPDHGCLFIAASAQHGYFTAAQARKCGFDWPLLTYHTQTGRFIRVQRGLYRLRDYPSSPREEVVAAWLAAGKDEAVVSHISALDLLDLSDIIPDAVHLTVPRSKRYQKAPPGVIIHTTTKPLRPSDVTVRDGVRMTAALRSILDSAEIGTAPEQIQMAVVQAVTRGLTTIQQLREDAPERGRRVWELVATAFIREPT